MSCNSFAFWMDPVVILVSSISVFFAFSWLLEKLSDRLGFEDDED